MKLLKKDNIKQVIILCIIVSTIIAGITSIVSYIGYKHDTKIINENMAGIIYQVVKDNPDQQDNIISYLNGSNKQDQQEGKKLLAKYGLQIDEDIFVKPLKHKMKEQIKWNGVLAFVLGIMFLIVFLIYIVRKDRKLEEITTYLKKIENKEYALKIEDNTEGQLSELRNEIYKITVQLREQTEQLQQEKKFLADSLSDISHQLKTPLTSVSVMVDILKEDRNIPPDKKREFLFEIARQLTWINWLVISLLKLSKLDARTVQLKKETVQVKKLIQTAVKNLSIPIEIKNQNVIMKGNEQVSFEGDFNWTLEAIVNIIKNCLEHTKENGTVQVNFIENALYTQISIQDNGVGIPKEDLPYIFKRFYKGKNASKNSVGIGLALAKSIIENQQGDIKVNSYINEGTTFTITFYKGVI